MRAGHCAAAHTHKSTRCHERRQTDAWLTTRLSSHADCVALTNTKAAILCGNVRELPGDINRATHIDPTVDDIVAVNRRKTAD